MENLTAGALAGNTSLSSNPDHGISPDYLLLSQLAYQNQQGRAVNNALSPSFAGSGAGGLDDTIYLNTRRSSGAIQPTDILGSYLKIRELGDNIQNQSVVRDALQRHYVPGTGQLDKTGFLNEIGRRAPSLLPKYQSQFAQIEQKQAEARIKQMEQYHSIASVTVPNLGYLLSLPDNEAAKAYPNIISQLKSKGIPMNDAPSSWDRKWAMQGYQIGSQLKEQLSNELTKYNIRKSQYGGGSPNQVLTNQFDKLAEATRNSQMYMNQMLHAYHNPNPPADASLIINAYKIKYPNAPDVNSLAEIANSASKDVKFKNWVSHALHGGISQPMRDDIMRESADVFRANMETYRGVQDRIRARQKEQAVTDPTLTSDPGLEKTLNNVNEVRKELGPYKSTAEEGRGFFGGLMNLGSKIFGVEEYNENKNKLSPGSIVNVKGKHYRVLMDGKTLVPVGKKK